MNASGWNMIQKYVNMIDWVSDISKSTDWDLFSKLLINLNQCLLSFETTSATTLVVRQVSPIATQTSLTKLTCLFVKIESKKTSFAYIGNSSIGYVIMDCCVLVIAALLMKIF